MKTILLRAAGVFVLAAIAFSGSAQAQCVSNGSVWSCATPPVYQAPYWDVNPYPMAYPPGAYTYPGYKPPWFPSYPGPRAGR